MSVHYIFEHHEGGLFSNINKIVTFLAYNKPGKITWNCNGQPFGAFAYNFGEVLGQLFKNVIITNSISSVQIIKEFEFLQYTGKNADILYTQRDQSWRELLNKSYTKYIHPTEALKNKMKSVDKKFAEIKQQKIGILKRNQLLKCEQVTNMMPDISSYKKNIPENSTLYLSVDNYRDLKYFCSEFDCHYNSDMKRTETDTDMEPHFTPGNVDDLHNNFLDVYALSKCDYLIHPVSNMSTAALYMNTNLKSIYLR